MLKKAITTIAGLAIVASVTGAAMAAEPALPNGASSLREQYSDWTVLCGISTDKDKKKTKICSMQQEQVRQIKNGPSQRVLAVDLKPSESGLEGILVLPLGLKLADGAVLKIDDGKPQEAMAFRTCLFAGCVADMKIDGKMVGALAKGKTLSVKSVSDEGKETPFSISLNGFQSAFNRLQELTK
ncbi:invasion associated locus B family protein [Brucella cytisi]|uniref:Invasion associated locus B family protein n=1 Tax=Brucella cytisi TaxID=407152 RepID=A0A1J6HWQ1_9HYPH|nr:invasion associated locus B family protein [Brucella cytisi]OIS91058.1 hypothetical protein BLA27_23430 [Brucella cytisi]